MVSAQAQGTSGNAQVAKDAIERVCSGAQLDCLSKYYSPRFVDHVNGSEFKGHVGVTRSVEQYRKLMPEMSIAVEEQLVDGQRVASRFVVSGTAYGRRVRFAGITISHIEDGLIIEDWSVTDTFGMLRQLGLWRFILVILRSLSSAAPAKEP
jgi:predicted ester cyclase